MMCVGHWGGGEGVNGSGGSGSVARRMRVPVSSQSIQSKYLYYLMENLYTKVNDVCMYKCIHAY